MHMNMQATYPTCKVENKFLVCLNNDYKKWADGKKPKQTKNISVPTKFAKYAVGDILRCEYKGPSTLVPQLTHYKNSGGVATFTKNYDQCLGCCISNANLEFHRFEAQTLLMQYPRR
jgi:hypothetical protein